MLDGRTIEWRRPIGFHPLVKRALELEELPRRDGPGDLDRRAGGRDVQEYYFIRGMLIHLTAEGQAKARTFGNLTFGKAYEDKRARSL